MNSVSNSIHVDKAVSLIRKNDWWKTLYYGFAKSSAIETGTKYLSFDIDYDKGGVNPFSCKVEKRGYRLHVSLRKKNRIRLFYYSNGEI